MAAGGINVRLDRRLERAFLRHGFSSAGCGCAYWLRTSPIGGVETCLARGYWSGLADGKYS